VLLAKPSLLTWNEPSEDTNRVLPASKDSRELLGILNSENNSLRPTVVLRGSHPSEVSTAQLEHSCNEQYCSIDC
jgi:hypothetical protein